MVSGRVKRVILVGYMIHPDSRFFLTLEDIEAGRATHISIELRGGGGKTVYIARINNDIPQEESLSE